MTAERLISRTYGALELKQNYQHGLLLGLLAAALLHVGALWALSVYGGLQDREPLSRVVQRTLGEGQVRISHPIDLPPEAAPPGEPSNEKVRESRSPVTQPVTDQGVIVMKPDSLFVEVEFTPTPDPPMGRTGDPTTPDGSTQGSGRTTGNEVGIVPGLPESGTFVFTTREPEPLPNQPQPKYSEMARIMSAQGTVTLNLLVSESGDVLKIELIDPKGQTPAVLVDLAMEAVRGWKFKPALQYDRAVAVWYIQTFRFELR